MNIETAFSNIGFTEKERHVYLALLELGEATVMQVAKKSGLKRPTVYNILNSLSDKGFAARVIKGKKKFFEPQHPRKLITEAELRLQEVRQIAPQLESLFRKEEGRPRVRFFEGKAELDNAYSEAFGREGECIYLGTLKLSQDAFPKTFKTADFVKLSPRLKIRELLDKSEETKAYAARVQGPYREVRFLPEELLPFEADIGIYGNHVVISSVKKEYFAIDIESEETARAFRGIYEIIWRGAKECV